MAGNQDKMKLYTVEQLLRKYDFDRIAKNKKAIEVHNNGLTKIDKELSDFVKIATNSLENLQDQVDGNITTWFFVGIPTLDSYPSNEWVTDEDKIKHLGDLYYDQDTGYAYRFALQENIYTWIKITDSDVTEALALANAAQDTADKKRRVFVATPIPPYDNGDLWFNNQEIYICQIAKEKDNVYEDGDFIIATKYTDDTLAKEVDGKLTIVSGQVTIIKEGLDEISQTVEDNKYYVDEDGNKHLISQSLSEEIQRTDLISQTVQSHSSSIQGLNPVLESEGNGQLSLPDCAGEKLLEFTVEGKSEQETSVQGNNILGLPEGYTWTNGNLTVSIEDGVIVFNGSTTSTGYFDIPINPTKVSGDYIYALSGEGDNLDATSFTFCTADKTAIGTYNYPYADGSQRAYKLTDVDETIEYIHVWWAANLTYNNTKFYYMLNEGTEVIPFEKFIPNSPSPDYPSEIKSKKGVENLFDINTTATPDYIVDGKISIPILTYTPVIFYYKVKANKQCAISFKNNNASSTYPIRFQIKTTDVNQNVISTIVNDTITSTGYARTFTPSTEYIRVEFFRGVETTEPTIIDEVCLKEGTFTLNYVPYGSNYLVGKVIGKNRLNIYEKSLRMQSFIDTFEILEDDWIHFANTSGSIRTYRFKEFKVEPNTPYSVFVERKEITGASPYNIWQEFDENWNAVAISYPNSSRIITTNVKTKYVSFAITSNNQNQISDYKVRNMVLKSDVIDTEYKKYNEVISRIDLKGNKLCSNKDLTVRDLLTVKNGTANIDKKINEIVLNGSESNWVQSGYTNENIYSVVLPYLPIKTGSKCMCDKFAFESYVSAETTHEYISTYNYDNAIRIGVKVSRLSGSNIEAFKTWLSSNPITVQFELETPEIIDLGEVSIETVQSDCTLELEEELDTDMYAKYIKNNPYNEAYSTRLDTKAQIQLSENKIESSVSETILQNTELMQGEIDSLSSNLANNYMTSEEVQNLNNLTNESLAVITNEFKQIQTSTQTQFQAITNILQNGVNLVKTTYTTIDDEGIKIAKSTDSFNSTFDNRGLKLYSYTDLMAVYTNKGAGVTNLLVTGTMDLGYSKIMKVTQNEKKYTGIFFSDAMVQTLEDFVEDW